MKILIDGRFLVGGQTGIGKYLINALIVFARSKKDWSFCVALPVEIEIDKRLTLLDNVSFNVCPVLFFSNIKVFWFMTRFIRLIRTERPDLVWYPGALGLPFKIGKYMELCTVHDVVFKELGESMTLRNKLAYYLFMDRTVNRVDMIWANSNHTAKKIRSYYPKRKCREIVVGMSIDQEFYHPINVTDSEKANLVKKLKVNFDKKVLLFVGTLEPRKNLQFLLSLMPCLALKGFELIVVGGSGWRNSQIYQIVNNENFPSDSVHFAGYLSDIELRMLYNICDCYISTSLYEGFGMPQLEAMACNTLVITANNTAMAEVVQRAGVLVDGWEKSHWIKAIESALDQEKEIKEKYPRKLAQYDWNIIIHNVTDYIEKQWAI